ncbi:hypothetical protein Val02_88280 [Virgisporangium aliadipatigenens]|uniref:Uncharacterized protein n=1 Tax=Virgisporangium aliadipatigenens TaxID=741659 RepID=A0A8J4DXC0_9ACTN|nr:hypothetical protein [Virgisporangium aliadipatigenens]GIJ51942.1 hypothetical protein Val02_88280 [Virgisporangium aliadipatigenens]
MEPAAQWGMQLAEVSIFGVRTSVTVLRHKHCSLRYVLMPVVHVGRPDYYERLAARLARCGLVVAEGDDSPSSTGFAFVTALRWSGQRRGGPLVHQDIDFAALGVPVVRPDAPNSANRRRDRLTWWDWADVVLLLPCLLVSMAVGGRNWLAARMLDISDLDEPRMRSAALTRIFVTRRDRALVATLIRLHDEHEGSAPRDIGVIYGGAHFPAVVRALAGDLRYRPERDAQWLTAIDF